ncbi:glycosyltransferase [Labrys okinawensis]|uniref:glycosyltransferase n=1 Tax=Labrys okinawensis TaxID=346911 RepID=UPI0039BD67AB
MKILPVLARIAFPTVTTVEQKEARANDSKAVQAALPSDFDWNTYTKVHKDLSNWNRSRAEAHYVAHGAREGRLYSRDAIRSFVSQLEDEYGRLPENFSWLEYIANYPDLAFITSSYEATRHFLRFGRKEGRIPFRFEPEVYRSMYFKGARISEDALLEHYQTIGRPAGALATLEQIAKGEGLDEASWLHCLNVEEFNLLNSRWAGEVTDKQQALRAMIREGFDRIAPISFSHEFDPDYFAEANEGQDGKAPPQRYIHWLNHCIKAEVPGTPAAHLKHYGLNLTVYPHGFDWKNYAHLMGRTSSDRWSILYLAVTNDDLPVGELPLREPGASEFLVSLAGAKRERNPARAAALLELAHARNPLSAANAELWGDCFAAQEKWDQALHQYLQAVRQGSTQVPIALKAIGTALKRDNTDLAVELLRRTQRSANGDIRWRNILRDVIDAVFRRAWTMAEALYHQEQRGEADAVLTQVAADIASWWNEFDPLGPPLPVDPVNRVVMLANVDLRQCTQYRVTQKIELARAAGVNLEVYTQAEVEDFLTALPGACAAIFYRLPALPMNIRALSVCRSFGIPSYYDIDDLIFDQAYYPEPIETYGASVNKSFYYSLQMGVPLFRAAMAMCDYAISSTTLLAQYMEEVVQARRSFVLPNGIDSHDTSFFIQQVPKVRRNDEVVLFYGSGTKAHNSDFLDLMADPILRLMARYPNLRLMVVGFLSLDSRFDSIRDRIVQLGWTKDVQSYWSLLSEADIAMATLVSSPTTDCKSEIKWLEAAAFNVASVVSATHRYKEVLENGVDAFIANTSEEWEHALDELIRSPERRLAMVRAARAKALDFYSIERNSERFLALLQPAFEQADAKRKQLTTRRKKRILFFNIFFPPQTIGGSTRVARDNIDSFLASPFSDECEFAVVTSDNDNPVPYQLRVEDYNGICVFRSNSPIEEIQEWRPFNARYGQLFERVLQLWRPDLVHVHSIQRGSASILLACVRQGIPYINTIHDGWWVSDYNFLTAPTGEAVQPEEPLPAIPPHGKSIGHSLERRRRLRSLLEGSIAILGVSDAFTAIMHAAGYPSTRSVPNGTPHMERVPKSRSENGRVRMLQVSGQTHHKGFHLIQGAFKQGRFANLELTIVDHQRYGGPILETRWGDTLVRFVGKTKQEEMHTLYATQDVLLVPSVWPESFGLVSREASAAGMWVLASDRGAIGEGIEHGVNGWVIDVSTLEPLLRTLEAIDANPERYLDSPPQVHLSARTAEDQATDLIGLYREILSGSASPSPRPYFMTDKFVEDEDASPADLRWLKGERETFFAKQG